MIIAHKNSNFKSSQVYTFSQFWTSHGLAKGITCDSVGLGNGHAFNLRGLNFWIQTTNLEIYANSNGLEMNLSKNISI